MKTKLLVLAAMAGMCAFGMLSCRTRSEFSAGRSLSPAEAQAVLSAAQEKEEEKSDLSEKTEAKDAQEAVFYYVKGSGTVYHSVASCGYLKNSQNVCSGSLSQVKTEGKTRLCSACQKAQDEGQPMPEETGESASEEERICYYTAGGKVWHYDRGCASLANSENVQSGTETQAALDGKTRPCARCGD